MNESTITRLQALTALCVSQYLFECDPHGRPSQAPSKFWDRYEAKRELLGSLEVRRDVLTFGTCLDQGYELACKLRPELMGVHPLDFELVPYLCERLVGERGEWIPGPVRVADIIIDYLEG